MNPSDVTSIIDTISHKIGVVTPVLVEEFVKSAQIQVWGSLFTMVVGFFVAFMAYATKPSNDDFDDSTGRVIVLALGVFVGLFMLIPIIDGLQDVYAPHVELLKHLLRK